MALIFIGAILVCEGHVFVPYACIFVLLDLSLGLRLESGSTSLMTLYTGLDLDGLGLVLSLMVIIDSMGISHVAGPSWRSGPKMSPSGDSQTPGLDPRGCRPKTWGTQTALTS